MTAGKKTSGNSAAGLMPLTVLVVGGNRGIGLAFVKKYVALGYNVYATYRKSSQADAAELLDLESKHPDNLRVLTLDLADEDSIVGAAVAFDAKQLDVLINCGAVCEINCAALETTADELMTRFRINCVGPFLTTREFLSHLGRSRLGGGSAAGRAPLVVNLTSEMASLHENRPGNRPGTCLSYRASKAALNMMTVTLARELAAEGVACVALSPGRCFTKMAKWRGVMEPEESVESMVRVIDGLRLEDSARFLNFDGEPIAW